MNWRKLMVVWGPVVGWMGLIFFFSTLPQSAVTEVDWQEFAIKKTAHMVEYGLLFVWWYRAGVISGWGKIRAGAVAFVAVVLYGASDEIHQMFTPGREPKMRDVGFDILGGLLAWLGLWRLLPRAPKKLLIWAEKLQLV